MSVRLEDVWIYKYNFNLNWEISVIFSKVIVHGALYFCLTVFLRMKYIRAMSPWLIQNNHLYLSRTSKYFFPWIQNDRDRRKAISVGFMKTINLEHFVSFEQNDSWATKVMKWKSNSCYKSDFWKSYLELVKFTSADNILRTFTTPSVFLKPFSSVYNI